MTSTILPIHFEQKLTARKIKKATYLAPFLKKYRDRLAYSKIPETRRIAYTDGLLTDDGKLFYVKNSKAGCTTIAQLLYNYSKGAFYDQNIHDERQNLRQYQHHWRSFEKALGGSAHAFTFVRHPESRLISAFQNFFVNKINRSHDKHLPPLESRGFSESNSRDKNFGIFLDYVEESLETDKLYTDRHWRPQHINVAANDIRYSVIGKLENFEQDIERVFALIDRSDFPTKNRVDARYNSSKGEKVTLCAQDRSRIEKLYETDYEIFGY
jgi:hypothetical protein